jgi:hypothetical protein
MTGNPTKQGDFPYMMIGTANIGDIGTYAVNACSNFRRLFRIFGISQVFSQL